MENADAKAAPRRERRPGGGTATHRRTPAAALAAHLRAFPIDAPHAMHGTNSLGLNPPSEACPLEHISQPPPVEKWPALHCGRGRGGGQRAGVSGRQIQAGFRQPPPRCQS